MSEEQSVTFLCLASELKGIPFIEEAKRLGCRVLLIVKEKVADKPWPREMVDGFFQMPELYVQPDVTYAVSYLARSNRIDSVVALDDFDHHLGIGKAGHRTVCTALQFLRQKKSGVAGENR